MPKAKTPRISPLSGILVMKAVLRGEKIRPPTPLTTARNINIRTRKRLGLFMTLKKPPQGLIR
jgi:hypothetical protein